MEQIYKAAFESNNNFLLRKLTETERAGIFCVPNIKKENFLQVSNVRLFQEKKSVIRQTLKFQDFVSILSCTLTQGMTSDK